MRKKMYLVTTAIVSAIAMMSCDKKTVENESNMATQTVTESPTPTEIVSDDITPIVETREKTITDTTETETDNISVDDKGNLVLDTESKDVTVETNDKGEDVATIKTDNGDEVKVVVKKDEETGKIIIDNTKTVDEKGNVAQATPSENKKEEGITTTVTEDEKGMTTETKIKVDENGRVVVEKTTTTTVTITVTVMPTSTPIPTKEIESTEIPKVTESPKITDTPIPKVTDVPTPRPTETPTVKPTPTNTPIPAVKATDTPTPKPTSTPTQKPTNTPTPTIKSTDTPTPTVHTHKWVEQTKTVHHEEVGHYEEQSTTWEEKIYYTGYCINTRPIISLYQILKENNMWSEDAWETITVEKKYYDEENGYYNTYINVGAMKTWSEEAYNLFRKYQGYESTTKLYSYYIETITHTDTKNVWVVDKNAYDETVVTGYKCSGCGATK